MFQYFFNYHPDNIHALHPKGILTVAKDLLLGKVTFEEGEKRYWDSCMMGDNISLNLTYEVESSLSASITSLGLILQGIEEKESAKGDLYVINSVDAYSVIDPNKPGESKSYYPGYRFEELLRSTETWSQNDILELRLDDSTLLPLKYNWKNRIEFWKWWLTEAIPQAWELAQQSSKQ